MVELPKRLKHDAVVEALLEIRFEHDQVNEVIVGQLATCDFVKGFAAVRLPTADMPTVIVESDMNLRHQPTIQLQSLDGRVVVKVGPRVISIHVLAPYCGWDRFLEFQKSIISALFDAVKNPQIIRIGLRYINALSTMHGFKSFWDMNVQFQVNGRQPAESMAASYRYDAFGNTCVQVQIADPSYVQGPLTPGAVAMVDVDLFTPNLVGPVSKDWITDWSEQAHDKEKEAFFNLWPEDKLSELKEI